MGNYQNTYKISSADRVDKGVTGLPDTPGLSTGDMQARFDSLGNLAIDKFNNVVDSVGDAITNDDTKLPTMAAIVAYVSAMGGGDMTKAIYDTDDDGVVDNAEQLGGHNPTYFRNDYQITLPTTGYTSETVTIWGDSKAVRSIVITADKDGNPLSNLTSGMKEDYPINLTGSNTNFSKLYAYEIGNAQIKVYMTAVPSAAFNIMIRGIS